MGIIKNIAYRVVIFGAFSTPLLFSSKITASSKNENAAVAHVRETFPYTKDLNLYPSPNSQFRLIKENTVIKVETAETVPFSQWNVIILKNGRSVTLTYANTRRFNGFIRTEKLNLENEFDYLDFIELFVGLACRGESPLKDGSNLDRSNFKEEFKSVKIQTSIVKSQKGDIRRLTFYTVNQIRAITMWRVTVKSSGTVGKIQRTVVTHN